MPTESRESRTAGGRIEAATLLECGLVQAIGVGCKYLQQDMLSRRRFPSLCSDASKIGIALLTKLRVGPHGAHVCDNISTLRSVPQITQALSGG
jgi:hypothetical protein